MSFNDAYFAMKKKGKDDENTSSSSSALNGDIKKSSFNTTYFNKRNAQNLKSDYESLLGNYNTQRTGIAERFTDDYVNSYSKDYAAKYRDYTTDYNTWAGNANKLYTAASDLKGSGYFEDDDLDEILKSIDAMRSDYKAAYGAIQGDYDFRNQFADESAYNDWQRGNRLTEKYGFTDETTAAEVQSIIDSIDAERANMTGLQKAHSYMGDADLDYNWLKNKVQQLTYAEADIGQLEANVEELEAKLKDAKRNKTFAVPVLTSQSTINERNNRYDYLNEQYEKAYTDLQNAKLYQTLSKYSGLSANEDFAEKSKAESKIDGGFWEGKGYIADNKVFGSEFADYYNAINGFYSTDVNNTDFATTDAYLSAEHITEDERNVFNYLYNTQGEDAALEYISALKDVINYREGERLADAVGTGAGAYIFGLSAGVGDFAQGVKTTFTKDTAYTADQYAANMISENLLNKYGKGAQVAYGGVRSFGNMIPSIALSYATGGKLGKVVGNASMFASAKGNAYQQAINEGYTPIEARTYSNWSGASEVAMGYILGGIPGLSKGTVGKFAGDIQKQITNKLLSSTAQETMKTISTVISDVSRSSIGQVVGDALGEGAEEYLQEILEPVYRNHCFDENNEFKLVTEDALYSAIVGAITSGILGGSGLGYTAIETAEFRAKFGQAVIENGRQNDAFNAVEAIANDTHNASLKKAVERLRNKKNVTAADIGNLLSQASNANTKSEAKALKGISREMIETAVAEINSDNRFSDEDAAKITEAVYERARFGSITKEHKAFLENSEDAKQFFNDTVDKVFPEKYRAFEEKLFDSTSPKSIDAYTRRKGLEIPETELNISDGGLSVNDIIISSAANGEVKLKTEKGDLTVEEVNLSPDAALLLDYARRFSDETEIKRLIESYKQTEGVSVDDFAQSFNDVYDMGLRAWPMKAATQDQTISKYLDEITVKLAYDAGIKERKANVAKAAEAVEKKTVGKRGMVDRSRVKFSSLNKKQRTQMDAIEKIAEVTGINVVFVSSTVENGVYKGYHGKIVNGNTIYIDVNAGLMNVDTKTTVAMLNTMSHELTHFIKAWSPEKYEVLERYLIDRYYESGDFEKAVKRFTDRGLSVEKAQDEVIANACEMMLKDSKAIQTLAKKDRSLAEKILDWLKDFAAKIKAAFKNVDPYTDEGKIMAEIEGALADIQQLWDDALVSAVENYYTAELAPEKNDGVRYQERNYDEQLDEVLNGTFDRTNAVYMGKTPKILADVGLNGELPMLTTAKHLRNANKPKNQKKHYHGLTNQQLRMLPQKIANPVMVMDAIDKSRNSIVVVTDMYDSDGNPVIVVIKADAKGTYNSVEVDANFVLSYYGKDGFANFIDNNINNNTFLFIDKEKSRKLSNPAKVQFFGKLDNYDFNTIIRKTRANVNSEISEDADIQYSDRYESEYLTERDILSEKFAELAETAKEKETIEVYRAKVAELDKMETELYKLDAEYGKAWNVKKGEKRDESKIKELRRKREYLRYKIEEADSSLLSIRKMRPIRDIINRARDVSMSDEISRLKEYVRMQGKLTHGEKFVRSSVEKAASDLMKEFSLSRGKKEFSDMLEDFYEYIASAEHLTWNDITEEASKIVKWVEESRTKKIERDSLAQEVLDTLKNSKVKLNDVQKSEIEHAFGGYNGYRRKLFPTVNITETGIPLDQIWQEWAGLYPDVFSADENWANMPSKLLQTVSEMRSAETLDLIVNQRQLEASMVNSIYDSYWNVSPLQTVADRYEKKIARLKAEHANRMKASREKANENAEVKKYRERILKNVKELNKWMLNPTDKKHVPVELQGSVAALLSSLDMTKPITSEYLNRVKNVRIKGEDGKWYSRAREEGELSAREKENAKWAETIGALRLMREAIAAMEGKLAKATTTSDYTGDTFIIDADAGISEQIDAFIAGSETINVSGIDSERLKRLDELIRTVKQTITKQNKMHIEGREVSLKEAGKAFIEEMSRKSMYLPSDKKIVNTGREFFEFDLQNAYYYGDTIGSTMKGVINTLGRGMSRMYLRINEIENFVQSLPSEHNGEDISFKSIMKQDAITFPLKYGEITLTKPQIMNLYLLSKRTQADKHLKGFGVVTNIDELLKQLRSNKNKEKAAVEDVMAKAEQVQLTESDISTILLSLSEGERFLADKLQNFVASECAAWGNEVTMELFRYKKFTEKNYWTIESDKSFLEAQNVENKNEGLYAIQSMGMTKDLENNANNTVVLRSIFEVFFDHALDMAKYSTMRIPVGDALKFLNYNEKIASEEEGNKVSSVRRSLQRAYGKEAETYLKNLIKDINGVGGDNRGSNWFAKIMSNSKAAAVAYNFRVAIQQPTSIIKATYYMDPKYLLAADKGGFEEAKKYSGLAYAKKLGLYDVNISAPIKKQLMGLETGLEKFTEAGMWLPGKADEVTWGWLWNACKAEISDKYGLTRGSDEYFAEVTKRFEEIINLTQVIDTPMNKAQSMRSKDSGNKQYTAFMSEPVMTIQLMLKSVRDARNAYRSTEGGWQKKAAAASKFTARMATVHATTALLLAAVQSIPDAFRDDDEYQTWLEKYLEAYGDNLKQNISIIGMIPYAKDVKTILGGGDVSNIGTQGFVYLYKTLKSSSDLIEKVQNYEDIAWSDIWQNLENAAKAGSYLTGIPASNILRGLESAANFALDLFGTDFSIDTWGDTPTGSSIYAAFSAGRTSDAKAAAKELTEIKQKEYREEDSKLTSREAKLKAQSSIRSSLTPKFKEEYLQLLYDGKSTTDLKSDILDLYLGYTSDTFRDWDVWARNIMRKYKTYEEYEKSK